MNVLVIGACNVNDSIYSLARDESIQPPIVAGAGTMSGGHTPYVHSVQEAIQFVRYVREVIELPASVRRYIFTDQDFFPRGLGSAFDEADIVLFEFSTPLEIEFGAYRLNRNELQRRLITPLSEAVPSLARPLGEWFHEGILKGNPERTAVAARALAGLQHDLGDALADAPEWRELFCHVRGRLLNKAEIVHFLNQLRMMFDARFAVVMPSLRYTLDGRGWGWPLEFTEQLEDACSELDLPLLDFDGVVRRCGPEVALMPDLYHHRPGFTGFLDEILRFMREVASKQPGGLPDQQRRKPRDAGVIRSCR